MPDVNHLFGQDIVLGPGGDLSLVDGLDLATQRIIRRLMTPVLGYIWHVDYGAGVPQKIGDTLNVNAIKSLITSQIFQEASVATNPRPVVTVTPFLNGVTVAIQYTNAVTGKQETLSFDASK